MFRFHKIYLIKYPKKFRIFESKSKSSAYFIHTLCLEFFFKASQKKKKNFRERERERKKEQAQFLRLFIFYFFHFFSKYIQTLYYRVDYSTIHSLTHWEKGLEISYMRKLPKLCLFFLSLSFKKNSSRHILNFTENFIYMLSQFCVVNLWREPRGLVPTQYNYCEEGVKFIITC